MPELSQFPVVEARFIEAFTRVYNALHGTAYSGTPARPGSLESGWDYRWLSPDRNGHPLDVQHTTAGSDASRERVHRKNAAYVNAMVQEHVNAAGHRGYGITLQIGDTPTNLKLREILVQRVCEAIDRAIAAGIPVGAPLEVNHWHPYGRNELPGIEIWKHGKDVASVVFGVPEPSGFYENLQWRLREAVAKKAARLGTAGTDLVLVIDFDLNGYDAEDVPVMRQELTALSIPFREIWAVDLNEPAKVHHLWPGMANTE